jgi:hypothetical protein
VLVIRRIQVTYQLKLKPEQQEAAQKVHGFHADFCPVAKSIKGSIDLTTELKFEDGWPKQRKAVVVTSQPVTVGGVYPRPQSFGGGPTGSFSACFGSAERGQNGGSEHRARISRCGFSGSRKSRRRPFKDFRGDQKRL